MRGGGVSFPHFWRKNHLSRSELILKTHHNHSLPRSKRELASFYRGRIVPASIDRKLVNNDDVPHGVAVDIFGPKKTIKWSQLWRNWVQQFLKDHSWFAYFPHSTRNISGIYSVMNNDDGLHGVSVDILKYWLHEVNFGTIEWHYLWRITLDYYQPSLIFMLSSYHEKPMGSTQLFWQNWGYVITDDR